MSFFEENLALIALAAGSGIALLWPMLNRSMAGVTSVSATEAVLLMNRSKLLILDVRDDSEFAQGHLTGAKHIPVNELTQRVSELKKFQDKPVLVYCRSGMRAKTACGLLKAQQFSQLHLLTGGILAWQEAKLPLSK